MTSAPGAMCIRGWRPLQQSRAALQRQQESDPAKPTHRQIETEAISDWTGQVSAITCAFEDSIPQQFTAISG